MHDVAPPPAAAAAAAAARVILQQQETTSCTCQESLANISVGGWIVLSLLAGIAAGVLSTLAVQCWRRRRELRYMSKVGGTAAPAAAEPAMQPACRHHLQPQPSQQPRPFPSQPPPRPAPAAAAKKPGVQLQPSSSRQDYFSPLNTNAKVSGGGSVTHVHGQHAELHVSGGGDTRAPPASDQQAVVGHHPLSRGASQHDARQQQQQHLHQQQQLHQQRHLHQHDQQPGVSSSHGSPGWAAGVLGGHQLPQEISSSLLSADCVLQPEDSCSPYPSSRAVAPAHLTAAAAGNGPGGGAVRSPPRLPGMMGAGAAPSDQQQQQQHQHLLPGGRQADDDAPRRAGTPSSVISTPAAGAAAAEIEDAYEDDDLDDDWRALLGGVDARLASQGAARLDARERAVAIKRLLDATSSRGVEPALDAAVQEVMAFRRLHRGQLSS